MKKFLVIGSLLIFLLGCANEAEVLLSEYESTVVLVEEAKARGDYEAKGAATYRAAQIDSQLSEFFARNQLSTEQAERKSALQQRVFATF